MYNCSLTRIHGTVPLRSDPSCVSSGVLAHGDFLFVTDLLLHNLEYALKFIKMHSGETLHRTPAGELMLLDLKGLE